MSNRSGGRERFARRALRGTGGRRDGERRGEESGGEEAGERDRRSLTATAASFVLCGG
jgi:hypothetical protein